MATKKGKKKDFRDIVIAVLILVAGAEFYFLYQSNESVREFFVHSPKKQSVVKKTAKKTSVIDPSAFSPKETGQPMVVASAVLKPAPKKPVVPKKRSYVAFVIDDWGYSTKNCQYLRSIQEPVTVAVLPNLPHSDDVMQCAHDAGKEIMLHLPMEAHNNSDEYPPDYLLKTDMSQIKIDHLLSAILDKMPLVDGVNNHMGSKATEDKRLMTTVFKQLKHRGLFYLDSRVTAKSVCERTAEEVDLPFASRDVFLDNVNERTAIEKELADLVRIAKKRGKAIAIGHDRALTMQVIEDNLPSLREQGIELVTVKEYIKMK